MPGDSVEPLALSHRAATRARSRRTIALLALGLVLAAGGAGAGQLQLTWVDNSEGQAGFRIERKAGAEPAYSELALQAPGVAAYTDATVVDGTTYCYRVQAYNEAGSSPYSNEACGSLATGLALAVSLGGNGQGLVASSPAGIGCSPTCSATYPSGTLVTLAASPASGSAFGGWSGGGCAGVDPCTLTGNTPVTVSATFTATPPSSYTLAVARSGPGTVTSGPGGINCGSDCSKDYPAGTTVTLNATPNNGATFLGWTGACGGTGGCVVVVNGATSVSAAFTKGKGKR
jgi:hypothetical protein